MMLALVADRICFGVELPLPSLYIGFSHIFFAQISTDIPTGVDISGDFNLSKTFRLEVRISDSLPVE